MAIEIKFDNNTVNGFKSIITAPHDIDMKFSGSGNKISGTDQVFNFYERVRVTDLALAENTPPMEVELVVNQLRAMPDASEAEKIEIVSNSRLKDYLVHGSSITTIAKNVIDIALKLTGHP